MVCIVDFETLFHLVISSMVVYRLNQQDTQERLNQEEDARNQLFQNKKKLEQEIGGFKKDIEDLELGLQKVIELN